MTFLAPLLLLNILYEYYKIGIFRIEGPRYRKQSMTEAWWHLGIVYYTLFILHFFYYY